MSYDSCIIFCWSSNTDHAGASFRLSFYVVVLYSGLPVFLWLQVRFLKCLKRLVSLRICGWGGLDFQSTLPYLMEYLAFTHPLGIRGARHRILQATFSAMALNSQ